MTRSEIERLTENDMQNLVGDFIIHSNNIFKIYEIGNFIKQLICTNKSNLLKQFLHQASINLTFARKWRE